jgi:hypothetical protein
MGRRAVRPLIYIVWACRFLSFALFFLGIVVVILTIRHALAEGLQPSLPSFRKHTLVSHTSGQLRAMAAGGIQGRALAYPILGQLLLRVSKDHK